MKNETHFNFFPESFSRWVRLGGAVASLFLVVLGAGQSAVAQQCVSAPTGLGAWYPLDADGTDLTGNNHAILSGTANVVPGKVGNALRFDGITTSARAKSSSSLDVGTGDGLTIEAWISPADTTTSYPLVEWNNAAKGGVFGTHFFISETFGGGVPGGLFLNLNDKSDTPHLLRTTTAVLTAQTYQHIAATYDRKTGQAAFYLNGVPLAVNGSNTPGPVNLGIFTPQTSYDLYLGHRPSQSDPSGGKRYKGDLDEVGIYNRALSQAEIQAIVNAGSAGKCNPLATTNGRLWGAGPNLLANEVPNNAAEGSATNAKVPEWSYGYRSAVTGTTLTPFTPAEHSNDPSGLQGWITSGQATLGVNTRNTPIIFNTGSGDYKPLLGQQMYLSPGSGNQFLVTRWTAPEAGDYRVLARWVDLDNHGGNGVIAQLIKNGSESFNCTDGQPCGYAQAIQSTATKTARAWMRARTISFNAGDTLDFVLGSLGDYTFDATAFNALIRRVPRVTITSPASGSELTGDVTFTVDVQHNQPIQSVFLFFDDQTSGIGNPNNPLSIKAAPKPGWHTVRAVATDADGAVSESPAISIYIKAAAAQESAMATPSSPEQTHFFRLCRTVKSGNWNDSTTWANGITPQEFDDAVIESGHHVVIDFAQAPRDLIVNGTLSSSTAGIDVKRTLFLNGTVTGLHDLNISTGGKLIVGRTGAAIRFSKVNNYGRFVINAIDFDTEGSIFNNLGTLKAKPPLGTQGPLFVSLSGYEQKGGTTALGPNTGLKAPAGVRILGGSVQLAPGYAPLIGNDGNTLIGNDGNTLIGNDGNTLIGMDSNTLISDCGAAVISDNGLGFISEQGGAMIGEAGSTLKGPDGARLIGDGGATLIGNAGGTIQPTSAEAADAPTAGEIVLTGGTITGTGELQGDVVNQGAFIAPGSSAGGIVVNGNYTQESAGSLVLELGGNTFFNDFSYDIFQVAGTANLGGNLVVKTIDGYTPAGQTVPGLFYGSRTGNFASISSNAQISFGANSAQVTTNGTNPPAPKALNIATRMKVETGDNALIAGFIITGAQPKKVIVRGIGPSLPFAGVLADPTLSLDNGAVTNDNWRSTQEQEIIATTIPPSHNLEAAIVATLSPGAHTAVLRGAGNATGIGVIEVYDLESGTPVQLANISSRGFVQAGDNVMIGGFIIGGSYPTKVIVRAIGPSLPFAGKLEDPTLELVDQNGGRISNDNWRESQQAEIIATTIPPTQDNESAIVATLAPGSYTAIVRGAEDTTGIAVVEAYNLQ